jgi:gentisate 1,2-dioxygenase
MDIAGEAFTFTKPETSPERDAFYAQLNGQNLTPLWEVLGRLLVPAPKPQMVPVHWRYAELRPLLMEAGRLLTEREAERRVLVLENPGLRGQAKITQTLFAGLQLILPGEIARSHRHVASAFRVIVEGRGAYTAVDGERTVMEPGDFVLTPPWTYHDHGNPGQDAVVWLDGLDVPLVNMLDTGFAEHFPDEIQPATIPEGDALARYGANLLPVDYTPTRQSSPVFSYPYARSREVLHQLARNGPTHTCHGVKMRFINPANGGDPLPTIAAFLQFLPADFRGEAHRSTDATVFYVMEGQGTTRSGHQSFAWTPKDIFTVPSWTAVSHEAQSDAVLFSFSDRPMQKALGLWREQAPMRD